jgi:hypothetical protein
VELTAVLKLKNLNYYHSTIISGYRRQVFSNSAEYGPSGFVSLHAISFLKKSEKTTALSDFAWLVGR